MNIFLESLAIILVYLLLYVIERINKAISITRENEKNIAEIIESQIEINNSLNERIKKLEEEKTNDNS